MILKRKKKQEKKSKSKKEFKKEIIKNEETEDEFEKIDLGVWKKIFKILIKDKKIIVQMIIAVILLAANDLVYPLLNKYALEHYFNDSPDFSTKWVFIAAYAFIAIALGLTVWCFIRAASIVEENTTIEIRKQAFDKLQKLSFSYYDTTSSGWIMARMTSDARKLASIISWGIVDLLWGFMLMIGILIVSIIINWRLALILIILVPVFLILTMYFRKKILKEYRGVRKINSEITASFNESFMGSNTTKTLVLEKQNLSHVLCIVVRYFGKIKLGAGGLVRAYTKSATEVLKNHTIFLKKGYLIQITFPYSSQKTIDYLLKNKKILKKDFQEKVSYQLAIDENDFQNLSSRDDLEIKIMDNLYLPDLDNN